jgi:hypothetical protein
MDAYAQYARWRGTKRVGIGNRRLAGMIGDFVYETSSAEDESRRILELLYERGKQELTGKDRKDLERFTSEHNRDQRRADGVKETHVSWGRIDELSQQIIKVISEAAGRSDTEFVENLSALDRMFHTTKALRAFRNQVDHRAPSDAGGPLHFYRDTGTPITVRAIWGWTEIAACYWTSLTSVSSAISMATGIRTLASSLSSHSRPLQWPPPGMSIHALRVLQESAITIPQQQLRDARGEWAGLTRRWNRT